MRSLSGFQGDICPSTCSTAAARSWRKAVRSVVWSASTVADQRVPMVGPCRVVRWRGAAGSEDIFGITLLGPQRRHAQLQWRQHVVQRLGHALRHGAAAAHTHDGAVRHQAAADTLAVLSRAADEVVCLRAPADFMAVGAWYEDFPQVTDDEVRACLRRAAPGAPPA